MRDVREWVDLEKTKCSPNGSFQNHFQDTSCIREDNERWIFEHENLLGMCNVIMCKCICVCVSAVTCALSIESCIVCVCVILSIFYGSFRVFISDKNGEKTRWKPVFGQLTRLCAMPFRVLQNTSSALDCNQSIHATHRMWLRSGIRLDWRDPFGTDQCTVVCSSRWQNRRMSKVRFVVFARQASHLLKASRRMYDSKFFF